MVGMGECFTYQDKNTFFYTARKEWLATLVSLFNSFVHVGVETAIFHVTTSYY